MMRKQAALAFTCTHAHTCIPKKKKTIPQTHIQTHTQAASLHLRNVTGLLLHSKPTGALNKHLFLPVNPPLPSPCCLHGSPKAHKHPLVFAPFSTAPRLPRSPPLRGNTPLKAIYTLTFGIQIKKRGQGEAERITVAYECDSCFARSRART